MRRRHVCLLYAIAISVCYPPLVPIFLQPTYIIALIVALTIHEWSHARVATWLGDPTPANEGRLTLNPIAHLDPLGSLLFLLVHFGWAKPVPINPMYFRHPKRDILLTAIAGPASNLILALLSFFALFFLAPSSAMSIWDLLSFPTSGPVVQTFFVQLCSALLFLNLGLMAFNLIPIAPLDGSKVLQAFIPFRFAEQYDNAMRHGPYILLGLLIAEQALGIPLLSYPISFIMNGVLWVMLKMTGQ